MVSNVGADTGGNWQDTKPALFGTYDTINGIKTFPTYNEPTIIVAWGDWGKIAFSTDVDNNAYPAALWEEGGEALDGNDIYGLTLNYPNDTSDRYVAVGSRGSISYSDDTLKTWMYANNVFGTSRITAVAYGNVSLGTFVAVGAGGKIAVSN